MAGVPRPPVIRGLAVSRHAMRGRVAFVVRRLVRFVVSMAAMLLVSFAMIHLIPGDPVRAALGPAAPVELIAARRAALGLDQPILTQLFTYIRNVLSGDFGTSFFSGESVGDVIADRLPNTIALAIPATVVALLVAVPLGMWAGIRTENGRSRGTETVFTSTTGVAVAIPEFLYSIALVAVFSIGLGWFPPAGKGGLDSFVLPVVALAVGPAAMIARIFRVETQRELGTDYVRLARAKRLPAARLYLRHVLPGTLTATLTVGGLLLSGLIAGSVLVESVFAWPGLGARSVESIVQKDYPVAQALILVYGAIVLIVNLLVDLLLVVLDPTSSLKET